MFNEVKSYDHLNNFITYAMKAKIGLLRNGIISPDALSSNFLNLLSDKYEIVSLIAGQDIIIYFRNKNPELSFRSIEEDVLRAFTTYLCKYKDFIYNIFSSDSKMRDYVVFNSSFPSLMYSLECFPNSMFAIRF